jgi:hypothetical protein
MIWRRERRFDLAPAYLVGTIKFVDADVDPEIAQPKRTCNLRSV